MSYNVRGADGRIYGPADLDTLRRWKQEGRILPDTILTDSSTGAELRAQQVPGLFDPVSQDWSRPPSASPYPRAQQTFYSPASILGEQALRTAWSYFWIGLIGIFCCTPLAITMYALAIGQSNKAMAMGAPSASGVRTASIILLIISIAWFALAFFVRFAFLSRMPF
jgi:hypothetical protein